MPSTSIFDRLAHQGTAASKSREVEEKKLRKEIERRHAADAAIKALHVKIPPPQDAGGTTSPIKSPKLTPQQQAAVFDRLANQETVSSAAHHHTAIHNGCSTGAGSSGIGTHQNNKASPRNHHHHHHHGDSEDAHQAVYNRLYKQETAASKAHHVVVKVEDAATKLIPPHPASPRAAWPSNATSSPPQPPSLLQRSPPIHPPIPISMNLYIRTHPQKQQQHHNGKNKTQLFSPLEIESNRVRKQINLHHTGKVSASSLTHDVITELFTMDFQPSGTAIHHHELLDTPPQDNATNTTRATTTVTHAGTIGHWQIGTAIVEELDGPPEGGKKQQHMEEPPETMKWFWAEKEAIHDTYENYSVAKAKAIIQIGGGSMYVDEYQYTVVRREK